MPKRLQPDFSKASPLHRIEVYIPIADNDGRLIDPRLLDRLSEQLMNDFGGVSAIYPYGGSGGVDGMYRSTVSEVVFRDKSAVLMVLAQQSPDTLAYFSKKLPKWERQFKQEKILVMISDVLAL